MPLPEFDQGDFLSLHSGNISLMNLRCMECLNPFHLDSLLESPFSTAHAQLTASSSHLVICWACQSCGAPYIIGLSINRVRLREKAFSQMTDSVKEGSIRLALFMREMLRDTFSTSLLSSRDHSTSAKNSDTNS